MANLGLISRYTAVPNRPLVTAMLLLPDPRREMRSVGSDLPVAQVAKYVVLRIGFGPEVSFSSIGESVEFSPNYIEASNNDFQDLIGVDDRWRRIEAVYGRADRQDVTIANLLGEHQSVMTTGDPISGSANRLVLQLMVQLNKIEPRYAPGSDPLPTLELIASLDPGMTAALPPPDEIGEDEPDIRMQVAQHYRMARIRGATARAFSNLVLNAYHRRCAFCGLKLSGLEGVTSGIDAAHILAWSSYDLDVLQNGIALCKLHHWAFDTTIMMPVIDKETYRIRFTQLANRLDPSTRAQLGTDGLVIPTEWLPDDAAKRPSAKYLKRLYEDLEVIF